MPTTTLLTGSTGNLGSYLLHTLSYDPSVSHIYCLNRTVDAPTRQRTSLHQRGLTLPTVSPDFQKITHLTGDLTQPDLGLDEAVLTKIRATTPLTILHNAWPVDFNRHFSSFVPQLHALHHLINLALSCTPQTARFVFVSSISAAGNWGALPGARASVPESLLDDWKVARLGYGQAKLVAERIIDEATRVSGLEGVVVRVGQVAGPVERGLEGAWPRQEWLPSLVRSSAALGALPAGLGPLDRVDWVPVDTLAKIVGELVGDGSTADTAAAATTTTTNGDHSNGTSDTSSVLATNNTNGTNPKPRTPIKPKDKEKKSLLKKHKLTSDPTSTTTTTKSLPSLPRKNKANGIGSIEYYHIVNPHGVAWSTLLPAVKFHLQRPPALPVPEAGVMAKGRNIRVVPFAEWVDMLERSAEEVSASTTVDLSAAGKPASETAPGGGATPMNISSTTNGTSAKDNGTAANKEAAVPNLDLNPAIKLLPFFKTLQDKAIHLPKARAVVLETRGTMRRSGVLAGLGGVSMEWMRLWMEQWGRERAF